MRKRLSLMCMVLIVAFSFVFAACTRQSEDDTAETTNNGGMKNPWRSAHTLAEAAEGAGLDRFYVSDDIMINGKVLGVDKIQYSNGLAECVFHYDDVDLIVRKGLAEIGTDGDLSGIYYDYTYEWTLDVEGISVQCFSDTYNKAEKIIWTDGDYSFAVHTESDTEGYGLSNDDVKTLAAGTK